MDYLANYQRLKLYNVEEYDDQLMKNLKLFEKERLWPKGKAVLEFSLRDLRKISNISARTVSVAIETSR
jgi:hypothetical protein